MTKKTDKQLLNERSLHLFRSLVEHFIEDGQPVGSRTLARDTDLDLSPATIRNVMADLEDCGLLRSPHTSAGRVPTVKGYRLFVDTLLRKSKLSEEEISHIKEEFNIKLDTEALLEKASSALSEITSLASVVMLPRLEQSALKQVEFVSLAGNRVLVILVSADNSIQNRVINTTKVYSPAELQQASNYLSEMVMGKTLETIKHDVLAEMQNVKDNVNQTMQFAIEVAQQAFSRGEVHEDLLLKGETNLMGVNELSDVEKLKKLFESFNQKQDILHLLEQSIHARGVQIFIGEESGYEVLDDCSVVTSPYEVNGETLGVLGVIGPTRMDYQRVIPIVDVTAKMLGSALNSKD